ncbi:NAD(+)/NADH kinase [Ureaplasma ceti]|uniref:NAD(+)/NADH kinase n=1 Tax=Ureaplasma ceti TaxID=3119530 RepID=A0ABP9U9D5_9BACT
MNNSPKRVKFHFFVKNPTVQEQIVKLMPSWIEDNDNYDLVIVLGGDGTFLHAMKEYVNESVDLLFINTGHVGFLSNIKNVQDLTQLNEQEFTTFQYLQATNVRNESTIAINEFTITRLSTSAHFSVAVDNQPFYSFFGSGLYVTTALGSSGLNRSFHGPLLFDDDSMCLFELGPSLYPNFKSLMQPLVLNKNHQLTITTDRLTDTFLKSDGQLVPLTDSTLTLQLQTSRARIINPFLTKNRIGKIKLTLLGD